MIVTHQFGIPWTVAVLGTALTRDHVRLLRRYVDEAVLVFDADNAGQTSASRSVDAFAAEELTARVVALPDDLDPDECLRRKGADAFLKRMEEAIDGVTFKLNRALARLPEGASASSLTTGRVLDDVLATVALMPNLAAQSLEIRKIARQIGGHEYELKRRLEHLALANRRFMRRNGEAEAAESYIPRHPEMELLQVMLTYPETMPVVRSDLNIDDLFDANIRALVQRALDLSTCAGSVGAPELLSKTHDEFQRGILQEIMGKVWQKRPEPRAWCKELINVIISCKHWEAGHEEHRKAVEAGTGKREDETRALKAWLEHARKSHEKAGTLFVKRNSRGGPS